MDEKFWILPQIFPTKVLEKSIIIHSTWWGYKVAGNMAKFLFFSKFHEKVATRFPLFFFEIPLFIAIYI